MGNSKSFQQRKVCIPSIQGQWVSAGKTEYCQLVKNTRNGIIAQQYHIPLDHRITPEQNEEIYQERRLQHDNLVTVYHVEKQTNQYLCQGKDFIRVKTQRIPYRLSEMNNLSFAESLYILREAMIGYRAITDFYGAISITDEMIGFTNDHKVKVWLNEEFAYNLPRENMNFLIREPLQIQQKLPNTITQLFSVIEEHSENGQFPQQFSKAYRQYPIQTFSEALQFIEDYAHIKGINLKHSLSSNSVVTAKTDYSIKQIKQKKSSVIHPPKHSYVSTLTVNPPVTPPRVLSVTPPPAPIIQKVAQPIRVINQVQPKKYYIVAQQKPVEKKLITIAEKPKDYKLEFTNKPSSNFTSTVSSNSNTVSSTRKVSQNGNSQGTYKLFSPREPKLTFTPLPGPKIPKPSQKTAPSEINFGQSHFSKAISASHIIKNQPEGSKYSIADLHQKQPNTHNPITFKQINKLWSPNKGISKQRRFPQRLPQRLPQKLPQRVVTENQATQGLTNKYQKMLGESKSTVSGNIKVQTAPRTISFNYSKGLKIPTKI